MSRVQLENITKVYPGNVTAVHDFNLDIKDKEFIVFVGPSGCGKSTTLRMIAGLEEISGGTLKIDGKIVNDLQPKDREVSMVFQNYALYPHLTVYENMAFPLRISKIPVEVPKTEEEKEKIKAKISVLENDIARFKEALYDTELVAKTSEEAKAKIEPLEAKIAKNEAKITALITKKQNKKVVDQYTKLAEECAKEISDIKVKLYEDPNGGEKQGSLKGKLKKLEKDFARYNEKIKNPLNPVTVERINGEISGLSYKNVLLKEKIDNINNKFVIKDQLKLLEDEKQKLTVELDSPSIKYTRMNEKEIYERVTNSAKILGISEYLERKPRALSGGQRQRVAIGRAMVKDCKVFLMDEPLSNLDAKLRNQMRAEIILLRQKINTTFVYVTHDQTEAMTLGDKIVVMKDGYIMQVGTPAEVFDHPDNLFVAEFIGAPKMNIVKSKLIEKDGKYCVEVLGAKVEIGAEKSKLLAKNKVKSKEVLLGVRPEHISLVNKASSSSIKVKLEVNEMMGSEYHLHVLTEDGTSLIVRTPTVDLTTEERNGMVFGKELNISFDDKVIQLFDIETEQSLFK